MQTFLFAHAGWLDFLQEDLLPRLLAQGREQGQVLRIWSVGCQTGDEAAGVALALHSMLNSEMAAWQLCIFATDVDAQAAGRARQRVYAELPGVDTWGPLQTTAFERSQEGYRLTRVLRRTLIFAAHDLLSQPPFPRLDLIVCHTPLDSWAPDGQTVVLNRFAYVLAAHRYLWLVPPSTLTPPSAFWQGLDTCAQLYQRKPGPRPLACLHWKRPPALPVSVVDLSADLYAEELQASLEEREVAYQELEERLRELEAANEELSRLNRLKEDFLAMASHELKTPLTSLVGYTELLQQHLGQEQTPETAHFLSRIDAQLTKLTQLVTSLLEVSEAQAQHLVLAEAPVEMGDVVREVVEQVHVMAPQYPIRLEAPGTGEVIGDRARLEQVLLNLLSNAIKYAPGAPGVVVRMRETQEEVQVSVQDFGRGIAAEHQPRLFERFYRVGSWQEQCMPGLGIGLYLAHEIIGRHGGRMWVESVQGQGATFSFALPRQGR